MLQLTPLIPRPFGLQVLMVFLNIFFPSARKRLEAPIGDFTDRTVFKGPRTYVPAPCRVRRSSPPRFWRIWWTHLGYFGGSSPRSGPHREIASDPTKTEPGLIRPESFILRASQRAFCPQKAHCWRPLSWESSKPGGRLGTTCPFGKARRVPSGVGSTDLHGWWRRHHVP